MWESKRVEVVTAGTAVRCANESLVVWRAHAQASSGNKGLIFVGASGVAIRDGSNRYIGTALPSGVALPERLENTDLYDLFVNAEVSGDMLQVNYQRTPNQNF